ncbi:MAG TPA: hypothetical protein VFL83_07155 [Anaeromyxobacter sp.]|nr:hypothetical protein [Anaeromyxobacter sp.]
MWTVFRFSLASGDARAYREALEILGGAGFRPRPAGPIDAGAPFPAAVVGDVQRAAADVTRVIFAALAEAGLRPVAVSGCALAEAPPATLGARA